MITKTSTDIWSDVELKGEDDGVWVGLDELKKVRDEIVQNQRMVAQQLAEYTDDEDMNYKTKRDLIIIGDAKLDTYKLVLNLFDFKESSPTPNPKKCTCKCHKDYPELDNIRCPYCHCGGEL